jgi:putative tryptophan/tyrosine transport system substrate-binding protein
MRRREFITLLGGAAAWPLAARAQTPRKIARIGWLSAGSRTASSHLVEAFLQGLRELDYVEGQTFAMEYRWAEGQQERLPELAVELVQLELDVLVAPTSAAVQAAMNATRTIPIIMAGGGDPVGLGLVASLARPGGNVTGPSMMNTEVVSKRVQMIKEVVPGLKRVAVLANSINPIHALFMQETEPTARMLGLELQPIEVHGPEDFEAAFVAATRGKAGALIAFDDALTMYYRPRIVALAAASRLPTMYGYREFPDEGGLISYGANLSGHYRHAAKYVDKVLKGTKPADLPVEQPAKFELVINLKTAKALGITVPPTLLGLADEVIE